MSGICYLVGTPIGNLKDITLRALDTLKSVDVVASEDTRKSSVLLHAYGIKKPLISYYKQKEREGTEEIIALLEQGKSVALITDAGMPAISDPGAILVRSLRERGHKMEVVPGPTAVTSAISLAGLTQDGFVFAGFLPQKKKEKDAILNNLKNVVLPLVFYCAPHDLDETLSYLFSKLGARKARAIKEVTKLFETVYEGTLDTLTIENKKGEFVLIVDGAKERGEEEQNEEAKALLLQYLTEGLSRSEAVKRAASETGAPKNSVYQMSLTLHDFTKQAGDESRGK